MDDLSATLPEHVSQAAFGAFQAKKPGFSSVLSPSTDAQTTEWWGNLMVDGSQGGTSSHSGTPSKSKGAPGASVASRVKLEPKHEGEAAAEDAEVEEDMEDDVAIMVSAVSKSRLELCNLVKKITETVDKDVKFAVSLIENLHNRKAEGNHKETLGALELRLNLLQKLQVFSQLHVATRTPVLKVSSCVRCDSVYVCACAH